MESASPEDQDRVLEKIAQDAKWFVTKAPTSDALKQWKTSACVHCGRLCGDSAGGWGSINGWPLCHPNEEGRPDCYTLVAFNHHDIPCFKPECQNG